MCWHCQKEGSVYGEKKDGLVRDSNPGPLAPEARIIPLDQQASTAYDFSTSILNLLAETGLRDDEKI